MNGKVYSWLSYRIFRCDAVLTFFRFTVEPDFEESDLDMIFDCNFEVPTKNGKGRESPSCDDPSLELKGPRITLMLKNKWKSCKTSYYNMTLFKDNSCSASADPTFSPVFKYDDAFSSSLDPIRHLVDQDNITFSSKYLFVVSVARYTFNNLLKVQERNKTKQSSKFLILENNVKPLAKLFFSSISRNRTLATFVRHRNADRQ